MAYTVPELIQLAKELRSLGVTRVKAGDVEMEIMPPPLEEGKQLAPEEMEKAVREAQEELDKELHAAS